MNIRAKQVVLAIAGVLVIGGLSGARSVDADDTNEEIRFVVTGVDVAEGGTVRCALYRDEATWLEPARKYRRAAASVSRPQAACVFRNVPPGTYAIAALHDENGDQQMDRSALGLPKEGYALSRNARPRMRKPRFSDAAVSYEGGKLQLNARMRY